MKTNQQKQDELVVDQQATITALKQELKEWEACSDALKTDNDFKVKELASLQQENEELKKRIDRFKEQKICEHSIAENLCDLLRPLNEQGFKLSKENKSLQAELAKLNTILYHRENGLSHPDLQGEIDKSKMAAELAKKSEALEKKDSSFRNILYELTSSAFSKDIVRSYANAGIAATALSSKKAENGKHLGTCTCGKQELMPTFQLKCKECQQKALDEVLKPAEKPENKTCGGSKVDCITLGGICEANNGPGSPWCLKECPLRKKMKPCPDCNRSELKKKLEAPTTEDPNKPKCK